MSKFIPGIAKNEGLEAKSIIKPEACDTHEVSVEYVYDEYDKVIAQEIVDNLVNNHSLSGYKHKTHLYTNIGPFVRTLDGQDHPIKTYAYKVENNFSFDSNATSVEMFTKVFLNDIKKEVGELWNHSLIVVRKTPNITSKNGYWYLSARLAFIDTDKYSWEDVQKALDNPEKV